MAFTGDDQPASPCAMQPQASNSAFKTAWAQLPRLSECCVPPILDPVSIIGLVAPYHNPLVSGSIGRSQVSVVHILLAPQCTSGWWQILSKCLLTLSDLVQGREGNLIHGIRQLCPNLTCIYYGVALCSWTSLLSGPSFHVSWGSLLLSRLQAV